MKLYIYCIRVTFFACLYIGNMSCLWAKPQLDSLLKFLEVQNVNEITAPNVAEDMHREFVELDWVFKTQKGSNHKTEYITKHSTYRVHSLSFTNNLKDQVNGILLMPFAPKAYVHYLKEKETHQKKMKKTPVLIYFHDETQPNAYGFNEIFNHHEGIGKDKEGWSWATHFMNQGVAVLAINAPRYGDHFVEDTQDYKKKWGLRLEDIRLYNDLLAYQYIVNNPLLDEDSITLFSPSAFSASERMDAFVSAVGKEKVKRLRKNRTRNSYLDVYGLLAEMNKTSFAHYEVPKTFLTPRFSLNFFREMISQANEQNSAKKSCDRTLTSPEIHDLFENID